jgi:hypothetical protein
MAIQRRPHGHGLRNLFVRASGWRLKLLDRFDALTHGDGTFEVGEQLATIRSHPEYPIIRFRNLRWWQDLGVGGEISTRRTVCKDIGQTPAKIAGPIAWMKKYAD